MAARMYIWPRYALEVDGERVEFTDNEGAIVARLFRSLGNEVSTDDLVEASYFDDPEGGPLTARNCISVRIFMVNRRMKSIGARITGRRGCSARCLVIKGGPEPLFFNEAALFALPLSSAKRGPWRYTQ